MYPLDRVTMLVIDRPNLTPESLSMSHSDWMLAKSVVLFPDGCARESSDHPRAGVTVSCKWQGHFVVAHGHIPRAKKKLIFFNFCCAGQLNPTNPTFSALDNFDPVCALRREGIRPSFCEKQISASISRGNGRQRCTTNFFASISRGNGRRR